MINNFKYKSLTNNINGKLKSFIEFICEKNKVININDIEAIAVMRPNAEYGGGYAWIIRYYDEDKRLRFILAEDTSTSEDNLIEKLPKNIEMQWILSQRNIDVHTLKSILEKYSDLNHVKVIYSK